MAESEESCPGVSPAPTVHLMWAGYKLVMLSHWLTWFRIHCNHSVALSSLVKPWNLSVFWPHCGYLILLINSSWTLCNLSLFASYLIGLCMFAQVFLFPPSYPPRIHITRVSEPCLLDVTLRDQCMPFSVDAERMRVLVALCPKPWEFHLCSLCLLPVFPALGAGFPALNVSSFWFRLKYHRVYLLKAFLWSWIFPVQNLFLTVL